MQYDLYLAFGVAKTGLDISARQMYRTPSRPFCSRRWPPNNPNTTSAESRFSFLANLSVSACYDGKSKRVSRREVLSSKETVLAWQAAEKGECLGTHREQKFLENRTSAISTSIPFIRKESFLQLISN